MLCFCSCSFCCNLLFSERSIKNTNGLNVSNGLDRDLETLCRSWSGSKLFSKAISIRQTSQLARKELGIRIVLKNLIFACGALAASISVGIVIPSTWFVYLYKQTVSITVVVMGTKQFSDKTTHRQQYELHLALWRISSDFNLVFFCDFHTVFLAHPINLKGLVVFFFIFQRLIHIFKDDFTKFQDNSRTKAGPRPNFSRSVRAL